MSGKIRNPERRCKICGNKCEKRMRYCKLCAREVKNFTAPRRGAQERKPPRQETGPSPAILEGTR